MEKRILSLQEQIRILQENLDALEIEKAEYGGMGVPPKILHTISKLRTEVQEKEAILHQLLQIQPQVENLYRQMTIEFDHGNYEEVVTLCDQITQLYSSGYRETFKKRIIAQEKMVKLGVIALNEMSGGASRVEVSNSDADILSVYLSELGKEVSLWRGLELRRNVRLADTYISRIVKQEEKTQQESSPIPKEMMPMSGMLESNPLEPPSMTEEELLKQMLEETTENRHILIEGEAGCGKSTLLRNWTFKLVKRPYTGFSKEYIPIWLPLGEVEKLGRQEDSWNIPLVDLVESMFPVSAGQTTGALAKILSKVIDTGNAVILVDAADEVPKARQPYCNSWLKRTFRSARQCPIVLTSRPCDFILDIKNETFKIAPFDLEMRENFIVKWFQSCNHADLVAPMKEMLKNSPRLNEEAVAGNPLFLTMMCIDFEYNQKLAYTPANLFKHFINILLQFWDLEKGLLDKVHSQNKIPIDLKLRVLGSVASLSFEQDSTTINRNDLIGHINHLFRDLESKVEADEIVTEIKRRSGILIGNRFDQYRFNHLLFQEFLVAQEKVRMYRNGETQAVEEWLSNNYENPRFDNIISFFDELLNE